MIDPTRIILLFGATGDLAREKLYPALRSLAEREPFVVIGLGRRYADHDEFVEHEGSPLDGFRYVRFDVEEHDAQHLADAIAEQVDTKGLSLTSYLSLPPAAMPAVLETLDEVHGILAERFSLEKAAVVEKPFGHDATSARALEDQLGRDYADHEIFRIDHYLGKTFVLNLLSLRFQNDLIARVWNRDSIESIQIIIDEERGIVGREGYYASMGVLKDMVQNHILQIAALLTMQEPVSFSADDIARAKHDALRRMRISRAVLGRYAGIEGPATAIAARIDLEGSLAGVPLFVRTGKQLGQRHATIVVRFRRACMICGPLPAHNELIITIQPRMRIEFVLNVQRDDALRVIPKRLEYQHDASTPFRSDYERIFMRILARERLIFPTYPEIEEQWRIVDIEPASLFTYEPGAVPEQINAFIREDGFGWTV
jgi:glucose-6-phosphate 1-dehydrogenase